MVNANNTGAEAPQAPHAPQPQPPRQPQPQALKPLAITPGEALRLAGIARAGATLEMLESTARQQIFRGNFPFPVIQIKIGKKRWRNVVRIAEIEAQLNPPPPPPALEIATKRGRGRPPNKNRAA